MYEYQKRFKTMAELLYTHRVVKSFMLKGKVIYQLKRFEKEVALPGSFGIRQSMNLSDLLQRTNQMLDQVTPAMKIIERAAGMAKNIQEFRDVLSEQARSGGLDEIYNKLKKLEEDRNEYIEHG